MEIVKHVLLFALILLIGGASYMGYRVLNRQLDNEAIHDCALDYRQQYSDTNKGITIIRPLELQVRECAWNKGVRNWNGVWSGIEQIPSVE